MAERIALGGELPGGIVSAGPACAAPVGDLGRLPEDIVGVGGECPFGIGEACEVALPVVGVLEQRLRRVRIGQAAGLDDVAVGVDAELGDARFRQAGGLGGADQIASGVVVVLRDHTTLVHFAHQVAEERLVLEAQLGAVGVHAPHDVVPFVQGVAHLRAVFVGADAGAPVGAEREQGAAVDVVAAQVRAHVVPALFHARARVHDLDVDLAPGGVVVVAVLGEGSRRAQ